MKDTANRHLKIQELCDCYAETDPLKEMSTIKRDPMSEELALKWIALAVLHGVNSNAEKITLLKDATGNVEVTAKYRPAQLPTPGEETGKRIIDAVRTITHLNADEGTTPFALGFRGNSMELKIKVKREQGQEKLTLHFPGEE